MKIIGCLEKVNFPELDVHDAMAKIDTGAYSGALHCHHIKVVKKGDNKKSVLTFSTFNNPHKIYEVTDYIKTYVRSSSGHRQKRYIINTEIEISGDKYPIQIGLSNRSDLKIPVLIGRRFLRQHHILVDVQINQELDDDGELSRHKKFNRN